MRLEYSYPLGRNERPIPAHREEYPRLLRVLKAAGGDKIPIRRQHKGQARCRPGIPRPAGAMQLRRAGKYGMQQVRPIGTGNTALRGAAENGRNSRGQSAAGNRENTALYAGGFQRRYGEHSTVGGGRCLWRSSRGHEILQGQERHGKNRRRPLLPAERTTATLRGNPGRVPPQRP